MLNALDPDRLNSLVSCRSAEMVTALFEKNRIFLPTGAAEKIYSFINGKCDEDSKEWFDFFLQFCNFT